MQDDTFRYQSDTTVNAGAVLELAGAKNWEDGTTGWDLTLNNATLDKTNTGYNTFNNSNVTVSGASTINITNNGSNNQLFIGGNGGTGLTGSGTLTVNNTGTTTTGLTLRNSGNATRFDGDMIVNGGVLNVGNGTSLTLDNTDLTLNGAILDMDGAFANTAADASVKSLAGDTTSSVVLGAQTLTLGTNNGDGADFAGVIGGTGALTKTGTGTQTLSGVNTYTGATTVTSGTLEVAGSGVLGGGNYGSSITVGSGGMLKLSTDANQTLSGVISGTGALQKNNSGTLTLRSTVANTYSGGTTINDGIVSLGTGGGVTSDQDALGTGSVSVNSGGELRLWISNTGSYTIDNAFTLDGGTVHGEDGIYDLSGAMTLAAGGGTLSGKWSGKGITVSGTISGTGALTIDEKAGGNGGEVILTANNNYTGGTTVDGGTLKLTGSGRIGNGGLTVNNGGTLSVATNAYNSLGGAITVNEGGTLSTDSTGQNAHNIARDSHQWRHANLQRKLV